MVGPAVLAGTSKSNELDRRTFPNQDVDIKNENSRLANRSDASPSEKPPPEKAKVAPLAEGNDSQKNTGASKSNVSISEYPNIPGNAMALADSIASMDRVEACQTMSAWLDELRVGLPIAPFTTIEAEAASWAALATPVELEIYTTEALSRLEATPLGLKARKRVFLALWQTFIDQDRRAFVKKVDPYGLFAREAR